MLTLLNGASLGGVSFTYATASRLDTVSDGTNAATYAYLANSPLVSSVTFKQSGTTRLTTTKSYDNLNRLTQISSVPSADSTVSFNYAYNSANQRTSVTNADSSRWLYQYDTLGQVTLGKRYWSDGTIVAGQQFEYGFDDIGNRKSAASGGDQWGANLRYAYYSANNLNQYTSRTAPGSFDVIGTATNTSTVTVNNLGTSRKADYYRGEVPVDNSAAPLYLSVTNVGVVNNGPSGLDIVTNKTGNFFVPQTPESFKYDADGNLTNDGRWSLVWDAENRLITMTANANVPTAALKKLDFAYDYRARRITKKISTWTGSNYVTQSTNKFLYDDWNLIAEVNNSNALVRGYAWGLDLSGTPQAAGGIGGLVTVTVVSNSTSYFVGYDGNGNVSGLVSTTNGTTSANYEYGPFGETIRAEGPATSSSPCRFSTKFTDDESDLDYYGHRYYNSCTGRWLTRDPIGEWGGINLCQFNNNTPLNAVDSLGDAWYKPWTWFEPSKLPPPTITLVPLDSGGSRQEISRAELEKRMSPSGPLPPAVSHELDRGCIGLACVYQGAGQAFPENAPGTQCYLTEAEANKRTCGSCDKNFVFAKQGQWSSGPPIPDPKTGQIPTTSVSSADGRYNYVTSFPSTASYAWMNNGVYPGAPTQSGRIAPNYPNDVNYPHTIWCSTCVKK